MAIHKPLCSAEYSDYSSVQLESAIAPKVIGDALARGVIFSAIVSDGDNKTHDVLERLQSTRIFATLPLSRVSSASLMWRKDENEPS